MSVNDNIGAKSAIKIKSEPGTLSKNDRLTTFKLPRDLTLGNVGIGKVTKTRGNASKKVFTPNLNVTRNKNADVKTSRDTTNSGRDRGRMRNSGSGKRGRGGGGNSLIQTSGLFSEGAAGGNIQKRSSSHSSYSSNDSSYQLRKPTINTKIAVKIDVDDEQKLMNDTVAEDAIDDLDDKELINKFMPIMLNTSDIKTENNVKSEFFSKLEANDYPENLNEFFNKKQQIFFMQLPDTLPGESPDIEPAESAEYEKQESSDEKPPFCTIKQLDEGLIGKIVRYKSGKTKLLLGNSRFDVQLGMNPGFLHELISINTNRAERSGNLIDLGEIQSKLNVVPDWEYILSKQCQS